MYGSRYESFIYVVSKCKSMNVVQLGEGVCG
ncbi:hypothetical protein KJZ99_02155 [bacterium]|nr:hypothetical protein [bacterium]